MSEEEAKPTSETAALAEVMTDPLNRFYRYKVAHWVLPLFMRTPLTPNHITYLHASVGIVAAGFVAQGTHEGLVVGFFLSEVRMILDCLDGVLARAKKISSPYGRTLDELGDGVAFLAMCIAMGIHVHKHAPDFPVVPLAMLMMAMSGLMGWSQDFYKRKFSGALKNGTDSIYEDILAKEQRVQAGQKGFITRFGLFFDWMQVKVLVSGTRREVESRIEHGLAGRPAPATYEVQYILKHAQTKNLRYSMRAVSLMCGDNAISLVNLGLLTGDLVATQMLVLIYGFFTLGSGILLSNLFLHGSRRELQSSMVPPAE